MNINLSIRRALSREQKIAATCMYILQIIGAQWNPDEDVSPEVLIGGVHDLEQLLPILENVARKIHAPKENDLLNIIEDQRRSYYQVRDAAEAAGAQNLKLQRQVEDLQVELKQAKNLIADLRPRFGCVQTHRVHKGNSDNSPYDPPSEEE